MRLDRKRHSLVKCRADEDRADEGEKRVKRIGITWLALLGLCLCVRTGFLHAEEGALDDVSSEDGSSLDSSISDGAATTVVEEEPPPSVPRLTLQDCIERALANRRGEWTAQIDVQKGQVLQATTSYVPRIQVEELVGPLPEDGDLRRTFRGADGVAWSW